MPSTPATLTPLIYRKTPGISYINTTLRNVWLRKYEALSPMNIIIYTQDPGDELFALCSTDYVSPLLSI